MQKLLYSRSRSFLTSFGLSTLVVLSLVLMLTATTFAQTTGALSGTVTDQSGAVVAGSKVTLLNEATADARETQTNQVGRFAFAGVRPGTYTIKVASDKFKVWQRTGVAMAASDSRDINDIRLEVGNGSEVVTVEGTTTQIDLISNGERAAVLSTTDIQKMALVSRNVTELLKILPGVSTVAQNGRNYQGFDLTNASPTGGPVGNGLSANGSPYRGGSMVLMDGANVIDIGCNCTAVAVPNPEFTQEVKVQTSNFAVDQPNGPVVFSVISKSGGNKYHGTGYFSARNNILNSNTWQNNDSNARRPDAAWYYPGGTIGGAVPGTKGKLLAWGGFEYYWQKLPAQSPLTAWVPTESMRNGNFSPTQADNRDFCAGVGGFTASNNNGCNDLSGTILPGGTPLGAGVTQLPASAIDPNMVNLMKAYFPLPNATSENYNWYMPTSSQANGWVYRTRVDYNISDATKLFLTYQEGKSSAATPAHIWWTPGNSVQFPGGGISQQLLSKQAAANFLHVFSPTLTNEMILTWNKTDMPFVANNIDAASRETVGWNALTVLGGGHHDALAPAINSAGNRTFGEMSQGNVFAATGQFGLLKATPSFQNNTTKVYKNHTFKMGFFYAMAGNYQMSFANNNGTMQFNSLDVSGQTNRNLLDNAFYGSKNPTANFLMGVLTGYNESAFQSISDMAFRNYSFYGMDDWKLTKRLTVNAGLRFDHVGRWYERTGTGMAVWLPDLYQTDVDAGRLNPGTRYHGIDPGIPVSGTQAKNLIMSPRFGFAYDVFGSSKTVIRGGVGAYRWNDQWNDYSGALGTAQNNTTYNLPSGRTLFVSQLSPAINPPASSGGTSGSIFAVDPRDIEVPLTYAYNLTISHQLPWRSMLEVAYVGNKSSNLLLGGQSGGSGIGGNGYINVNKMADGALFNRRDPVNGSVGPTNLEATSCGTSNPCPAGSTWDYKHYYALWEGYGTNTVIVGQHLGYSNYNALQVSWLKKANNFTANLNYSYSKALGIVNQSLDPYSVHGNYGILNIDRPHVFNASYSYSVGNRVKGNAILKGIANGWTISGTTTLQSGANMQSVYNSQQLGLQLQNASGGTLSTRTFYGTDPGPSNNIERVILPVYTCDPTQGLSAQQYINTSCIGVPAVGQIGDRQAPYLAGPRFFNQDLSLTKNIKISEGQSVDFRFSANNFFNHGNWISNLGNLPLVQATNGSFGLGDVASNYGRANQKDGQRVIMLGVKYSF